MRFSQYWQISGRRFLVSINEVMRSESIIMIKCLLESDFELSVLEDMTHDCVLILFLNAYVDNLDRGLKLPPSSLNNYVQTAFEVLKYAEKKIISFQTPCKNVALRILHSLLSCLENFNK